MAKSSSERSKQYRAKLATNATYREKERRRAAENRAKETPRQKRNAKRLSRARSQRYRDRKKNNQSTSLSSPSSQGSAFGNRASKMKAVYRARRQLESVLPKSPRRKREVISTISTMHSAIPEANFELSDEMSENSGPTPLIKDFLYRDDISRPCPGENDFVSVINKSGKRERRQKRILCFTLMEAFRMFSMESSEETPVCFSKFARVRQHECPEVRLTSAMPHNVCGCKYHQNFINLIESLQKHNSSLVYSDHFLESHVLFAGEDHEECRFNPCSTCVSGEKLINFCDGLDFETISYDKWILEDGRVTLRTLSLTKEDAMDELRQQVQPFITHHLTKRFQHKAYMEQKLSASENNLIMQFDFAENYSCDFQDEIQAAYYGKLQITLFTCCVWFGDAAPKHIMVASDNRQHNKTTAAAFLMLILKEIFEQLQPSSLALWSDGPSCQFKNSFMTQFLIYIRQYFNLNNVMWNFFATSHGKGPCDAQGGNAKRTVRRLVTSRRVTVQCASDFASAIAESNLQIQVLVCNDIDGAIEYFGIKSLLEKEKSVSGIRKDHCWFASRDDRLIRSNLSKDICGDTQFIDSHLRVGTVAITRVRNQLSGYRNFLGIIQSIADEEYEILFLKQSSPICFTLCGRPDIAWIVKDDILGTVADYSLDQRERYIFTTPPL